LKYNLFSVGIIIQKLITIFQLCSPLITQLILISCSSVKYKKIYPTIGNGKYDGEFLFIHSSAEPQKISGTVRRINSTGLIKPIY